VVAIDHVFESNDRYCSIATPHHSATPSVDMDTPAHRPRTHLGDGPQRRRQAGRTSEQPEVQRRGATPFCVGVDTPVRGVGWSRAVSGPVSVAQPVKVGAADTEAAGGDGPPVP